MGILTPLKSVVEVSGRTPTSTTHHNAATTAADGTAADLAGGKETALIQIKGASATGLSVTFKVTVDGTNYVETQAVRIADGAIATGTSGDNEVWQVDVLGVDKLLVDLEAITGGSVTITSKAV